MNCTTFCPDDINTPADVRRFFDTLVADGINFHPDDRFDDIIHYQTKEPMFSDEDADNLDDVMERCFEVCGEGDDLYELAITALNR